MRQLLVKTGLVCLLWPMLNTGTAAFEAEVPEEFRLIDDYAKHSDQRLEIVVITCWSLGVRLALHRYFDSPLTVLTILNYIQTPFIEYDHPSRQKLLHVLDLNCPTSKDVLRKATRQHLFGSPYRWLLLDASQNATNLNVEEHSQTITDLEALPDSNVVIAKRERTGKYSLYYAYKVSSDAFLIMERHSTWSVDGGATNLLSNRITSRRRRDLQGTVLTTSLVIRHNSSLLHLDDYREKTVDTITKVAYRQTCQMVDALNGTRKFSVVSKWGYPVAGQPGQWNGMIGELVNGAADIGSAVFFTQERISIIDYISMITPTTARFVFRAPPLSYVQNIFYLPFDTPVWISSVLLFIVLPVGLLINLRQEKIREVEKDPEDNLSQCQRLQDSCSEVALLSVAAICQQGPAKESHFASGRVLILFMFTSAMFLYISYSANIVSLLQSSSNSIKTLQDLLDSKLKFGVENTTYNQFFFKGMTEPVRKAIYSQKIAPAGAVARFVTLEEGVQRMREGLYAFHMELGTGYQLVSDTFLENEKCGLMQIDYLSFMNPWMPVAKRSPYKELIKITFLRIRESGLQSREVQRLYTKKPECSGGQLSFVSVGLIECYIQVIILIGGISTTVGVFIMELFIDRYQRNKKIHLQIDTSFHEDFETQNYND